MSTPIHHAGITFVMVGFLWVVFVSSQYDAARAVASDSATGPNTLVAANRVCVCAGLLPALASHAYASGLRLWPLSRS